MRTLLLVGFSLWLSVSASAWALESDLKNDTGAGFGSVSVSSSSVGKLIVGSKVNGVTVTVPSGASVPVWFVYDNANSNCSTVTQYRGRRIAAGNGYEFLTRADGWTGAICAILESGSTAVTIEVSWW